MTPDFLPAPRGQPKTDRQNFPQLKKPGVMSAIVMGHSVYFSSSLVGGGSLLYIPNNSNPRDRYTPGIFTQATDAGELEWALMACEVRSTTASGHRTGGNCGEPMAALSVVTTNPTATFAGAKVVTWGSYRDLTQASKPWVTGVMDPCMTGRGLGYTDVWGCGQLTGRNGLDMIVIPAGTQAVNKDTQGPTSSYTCYT